MYIVDTLSTYIICFSRFNLSLFFFQIKKNEPTNIISIISNNVLYIKFLARIPKNKICIENRITSEEENNTRKRKEKPRKWISKEFLSFIISYTSCVCVFVFFYKKPITIIKQVTICCIFFLKFQSFFFDIISSIIFLNIHNHISLFYLSIIFCFLFLLSLRVFCFLAF